MAVGKPLPCNRHKKAIQAVGIDSTRLCPSSCLNKKFANMHNRPGLVLSVILILMAVILTFKITTREPFEIEEKKRHQVSREDYSAGREPRTPTFPLSFPLACTLGEDCWIARYMDRAAGESVSDYQCKASTQNGHKGTDFAVSTMARMREGVDVIAAASGKVARLREGMADISVEKLGNEAVTGKECGNAVIIEHFGGWQTQYCHMKKGSITVKRGQNVNTGDKIGEIGLSGQTEYPHLHFSVRHNTQDIDPFDGGHFEAGCDQTEDPLWRQHIAYQEVTLMPAIFSAAPRDLLGSWKKSADSLPSNGAGIVLTARVFHARVGDRLQFIIKNPDGETFLEGDHVIDRDRQYMIQYLGKKRPVGGFSPGLWRGEVTLSRAGAASQKQTVQVTIGP